MTNVSDDLSADSLSTPVNGLNLPGVEALDRGCEICGALTAREMYTATDRLRNSDQLFVIARCEGCGVLRTLPEMSDCELGAFYPNDYWGGIPSNKWIRESQSEKTSFLERCGLTKGRILDVGCGPGFFLRALDSAKWERFGVETAGRAATAAARALGDRRVFEGTLLNSGLEGGSFDVVTMWSALEHMNAPRAGLIEARRIIKGAGSLIVQAPNAGGYQLRLFRGDCFSLDAPRHRYHFTSEGLDRLLAETGFEVYERVFFSRSHDSHALRQSLKAKLRRKGFYPVFYLANPFIRPFDWVMRRLGGGGTMTIAARAS